MLSLRENVISIKYCFVPCNTQILSVLFSSDFSLWEWRIVIDEDTYNNATE